MSEPGQFSLLFMAAKVLSGLLILLLILAFLDIWRRRTFPDASYGGIFLSQKRIRVVWILVLIGSFGVGIDEDPVALSSQTMEDPEAAAAASSFKTVGMTLPLPFYRYDRQRVYGDEVLVEEVVSEGFLIPWSLLWGLAAYFFLVVRWDPESERARRLLHGKRWREHGADHTAGSSDGNT